MNNYRIVDFDPFSKSLAWNFDSVDFNFRPFDTLNGKTTTDSKGTTKTYKIPGIGRKHVEAAYYNSTVLVKYKDGDKHSTIEAIFNISNPYLKVHDLSKTEVTMRYGILTIFVPYTPDVDKMKNKIPVN